jgi:CRP/FNR family transcriptional regulator
LPFRPLQSLAREVPRLQQNIYGLLSREIWRNHDAMMCLGSMHADERLALFLLDVSARYRKHGYSAVEFALRMSRGEIGSYLGLKLETVSRLFSRFHENGLIQVQGRAVKLINTVALEQVVSKRDLSWRFPVAVG